MLLRSLAAKLFSRTSSPSVRRRSVGTTSFPSLSGSTFSGSVENLEQRLVLYSTSGNEWPSPEVVTISFEPDGTNLGGVYSNMNSSFNASMGSADVWKAEILRAAQVWAQQTNINFVVVGDSGAGIGSGLYQQGSPTIGDIRIGGYDYGDASILATAYQPPPVNNFSLAGDIIFNTGVTYGVGTYTDLFTVAVHEIGHALGLNHSTSTTSVMYSGYNGIKSSLTTDDVSGIRAIYSNGSARQKDQFEGANGNESANDATNISSDLSLLIDGLVENDVDITTTSDVDFYKVKQKAWTGSTMTVKVQSAGLSLLAPKLTVYADDKTTVLGTATGISGSTVTVTVNGVGNNDVFYVKVQGANATAFGTGAYGLTIDCGALPLLTPALTFPNTTMLNGIPQRSGGGQAETVDVFTTNAVGEVTTPTIIVGATGLEGTAPAGSTVTLYDKKKVVGTTTADETGHWTYNFTAEPKKGLHKFYVTATVDGVVSAASTVIKFKNKSHSSHHDM